MQARRSRALLLAIGAAVCVGAPAGVSSAQTLQERVQTCGACHGEGGNSKMDNVPSLAGQPALFLTNQLILMRETGPKSRAWHAARVRMIWRLHDELEQVERAAAMGGTPQRAPEDSGEEPAGAS